jgi:hypothetical protein
MLQERLTSTLSQRQLPHGAPSTTSHRTFRARHETQARAALRLVTFCGALESSPLADLFLLFFSPESEHDDAGEPPSFKDSGAIVVICLVRRLCLYFFWSGWWWWFSVALNQRWCEINFVADAMLRCQVCRCSIGHEKTAPRSNFGVVMSH